MTAENPRFFSDLAEQQTPKFLWIGCSDSRVSANTIVELLPGEVFVHRNVANLVNHTDMNCLSVMQFAVEVLKVEARHRLRPLRLRRRAVPLEDKRHGLIDNWLRHIQDTAHLQRLVLAAITEARHGKARKLCVAQCRRAGAQCRRNDVVQDAWKRGQQIEIHGWIYGLKDGIIRDLEISIGGDGRARRPQGRFLLLASTEHSTSC